MNVFSTFAFDLSFTNFKSNIYHEMSSKFLTITLQILHQIYSMRWDHVSFCPLSSILLVSLLGREHEAKLQSEILNTYSSGPILWLFYDFFILFDKYINTIYYEMKYPSQIKIIYVYNMSIHMHICTYKFWEGILKWCSVQFKGPQKCCCFGMSL